MKDELINKTEIASLGYCPTREKREEVLYESLNVILEDVENIINTNRVAPKIPLIIPIGDIEEKTYKDVIREELYTILATYGAAIESLDFIIDKLLERKDALVNSAAEYRAMLNLHMEPSKKLQK
jgi:hypothetical protein